MKFYDQYNDLLNEIRKEVCFSDRILYRMCEENPLHDDSDVIAGKIMIIGRTYAAAIERRRKDEADSLDTENYYDGKVGPTIKAEGKKMDFQLSQLRNSTRSIQEDKIDILILHGSLVETFRGISGLEKRSLASKYLHFHCPDKFFIYDSRAHNAINKIVQRPDKSFISKRDDIDQTYGDFVIRMIGLQDHFEKLYGRRYSPRELDSFLLKVDQMLRKNKQASACNTGVKSTGRN